MARPTKEMLTLQALTAQPKVVNLTPHDVRVKTETFECTFKESGVVCRARYNHVTKASIYGMIPIDSITYDAIYFSEGFEPDPTAIYIVSKRVVDAIKDGSALPEGLSRWQFIYPDSGSTSRSVNGVRQLVSYVVGFKNN